MMWPGVPLPLFGASVGTYGLITAGYLGIAVWLTMRLARREGIPGGVIAKLFAVAVPACMVGARLLDALEYPSRYPSLGDAFRGAGSSIYGALLAGMAVGWGYLRFEGVSPLKVFDAGAPAMALGEAMTRIGCFLNGCCYGVPWDGFLAVVFPRESFAYHDQIARGLLPPTAAHSLAVHPVQLYSATIAILAFAALLHMFRRPHREGAVFYSFIVFYGVLRLSMAPLRQEALASMKAFSVAFIVVGSIGLLAQRRLARVNGAARSV
jgi:phosphatidylglycerol:prolipoprotein diacylglycerol transferase